MGEGRFTSSGDVRRTRLGIWIVTLRSQGWASFEGPKRFMGWNRDHAIRRARRWLQGQKRRADRQSLVEPLELEP